MCKLNWNVYVQMQWDIMKKKKFFAINRPTLLCELPYKSEIYLQYNKPGANLFFCPATAKVAVLPHLHSYAPHILPGQGLCDRLRATLITQHPCKCTRVRSGKCWQRPSLHFISTKCKWHVHRYISSDVTFWCDTCTAWVYSELLTVPCLQQATALMGTVLQPFARPTAAAHTQDLSCFHVLGGTWNQQFWLDLHYSSNHTYKIYQIQWWKMLHPGHWNLIMRKHATHTQAYAADGCCSALYSLNVKDVTSSTLHSHKEIQ